MTKDMKKGCQIGSCDCSQDSEESISLLHCTRRPRRTRFSRDFCTPASVLREPAVEAFARAFLWSLQSRSWGWSSSL